MKCKVITLLLTMLVLLSGCDSDSSSSSSSQVAVIVNQEEITVHQFNQFLKRVPVKSDDEKVVEQIKGKVLAGIIDQTLLLQAAKQQKVDRSIDVISAMEAAKNKVIVDAYINKALKGALSPTNEEIEGFYVSNSLLFSERKQYIYDKYIVIVEAARRDQLAEGLKKVAVATDIPNFLSKEKIEYKHQREVKLSEHVNPKLLKPLDRLQVGDIGFLKMSDGMVVIGMESIREFPVAFDQAQNVIIKQLKKEKREKAVRKLIQSLRQTADVTYNDSFEKYDSALKDN